MRAIALVVLLATAVKGISPSGLATPAAGAALNKVASSVMTFLGNRIVPRADLGRRRLTPVLFAWMEKHDDGKNVVVKPFVGISPNFIHWDTTNDVPPHGFQCDRETRGARDNLDEGSERATQEIAMARLAHVRLGRRRGSVHRQQAP